MPTRRSRFLCSLLAAGSLWLTACREEAQEEHSSDGRDAVLVVVPDDGDALDQRLALSVSRYLGILADRPVVPLAVPDADYDALADLEALAAEHGAGLVVVLAADRLATDQVDPARMGALGEQGFVLETHDVGAWRNHLDGHEPGATVVLTAGAGRLPRQYAAYELLRRMGVRFFHPEQEHVPVHAAADLRDLARRPTLLHRAGQRDYLPDFAWRSWSFHSAHPLEHLEAFSDPEHPIDEAVHVNDWIVKGFGNRFRGAGRGAVPDAARQRRVDELEALRELLGFPTGTGISLHNLQQGASAEIDAHGDVPARAQIEALVAEKLAKTPDARWFGISFGKTEFTTTPDEETVEWLNWAGQAALRLRPDISVEINVHVTGRQPTPHFGDLGCPSGTNDRGRSDYYDLAFHTDPRLGATVHTAMFYPLEGPARVYDQASFAHKRCLMEKASAQGRPLHWFPEGSWWLSFDDSVPMYLPLYLWARARDIELVKPLLASRGQGTLRGHRMFDSGHEWGYWQQDYLVGLMAWNADAPLEQVLGELFDPLCEPAAWREGCAARREAITVLQELMEHQRRMFLEREDFEGRLGGLYSYFAGEDQADRLAAESGMEFRPVRVAFAEVLRWDAAALERFRGTDLAALREAATAYHGWVERLRAIEPQVPAAGRPWLSEVIDGVEIDGLRASQAAHLYDAVISLRAAQLRGDASPGEAAAGAFAAAGRDRQRAEAVIRRREAAYRYPAAQTHGGGLTPATALANGTTYPYRVYTKAHLMTYWTNRHDEVAALLAGSDESSLRLGSAIAALGSPISLQWPQPASPGDVITIGPHAATPTMASLLLGAGYFEVAGALVREGKPRAVHGAVVRSDVQATTPKGGLELRSPEDMGARRVLASMVPTIRWAWVDDPDALVFAADPDADGAVAFDRLVKAPVAQRRAQEFSTEPVTFDLPVAVGSGGTRLSITLSRVVLHGRLEAAGRRVGALSIEGQLSVEDLVAAAIELAGFDEVGTLKVLATVWGFDPKAPPDWLPIEAALKTEQVPLEHGPGPAGSLASRGGLGSP